MRKKIKSTRESRGNLGIDGCSVKAMRRAIEADSGAGFDACFGDIVEGLHAASLAMSRIARGHPDAWGDELPNTVTAAWNLVSLRDAIDDIVGAAHEVAPGHESDRERQPREQRTSAVVREVMWTIAEVAEASYRRGFQQGHDAERRSDPLQCDLHEWRFSTPPEVSPPPTGESEPILAIHRLVMQHHGLAVRVRAIVGGSSSEEASR
jgi:hypothetical protein